MFKLCCAGQFNMKKQVHIPFEKLDWELFCKRGALMAYFEKDQLVFGMGDALEVGDVKFFQRDFFNENTWEYIPEFVCFAHIDALQSINSSPGMPEVKGNDDETYLEDINKALSEFNEDFEKVVLISRESYSKSSAELKELVKGILNARLGLNYGLWDEDSGILGSTPEILFSKDGMKFKSMALASTRPIDKAHELLEDKKELIEHHLVVKDLKNKLKEQKDLEVGTSKIEKFGNLAHLRTDISFESELSIEELASLLGPTAALGGYPQGVAKQFIKNSKYYSKHPNRKFGGVVGVEHGKKAFALVAIRNIQWDKESYWIESGGGVVKESTVENELSEIKRKRKVIRDIFFNENI
ncbi:MAG: hypothetical protein CME64_07570 [Halobacteriovoraceae bacterium]|nr:hypothetical protein [Halobacteriovoraceae bacterium]